MAEVSGGGAAAGWSNAGEPCNDFLYVEFVGVVADGVVGGSFGVDRGHAGEVRVVLR